MLKNSSNVPIESNCLPVVLVADDDDDNRIMLRFLLESWNYKVLEAKDGSEALSITETERPDLILMDVRMPRFDGFETARQIRRLPETERLPIIFISGCAQTTYRESAAEVGGNDYLIKPLNFDHLKDTLAKYIYHK